MNKTTEIVIIGAGIIGTHISYYLTQNNIPHLLLDKNKSLFEDNASSCAGAFINPTIGKNSTIKSLMDTAFTYSTSFYNSLDKDIFIKEILSLKDSSYEQYEKNIPHTYKKISAYGHNGYLFSDAMTINPLSLAKILTKKSDIIFDYNVSILENKNNKWIINNEITANKVIISTGSDISIIDEPYIQIRGVSGIKIDINTTTNIKTAINKKIYFSKTTNNTISIGATHHQDNNICKDTDIKYLLDKIQQIIPLENIKIQNIKQGIRACSHDYFPIVSKVIDSKKTLEKYPYIKYGTKILEKDMILKNNMFICNGVGGRGFSLSPYISNQLINYILYNKPINKEFSLYHRFIKYSRRDK
jgi:glycine/D-amino acid oxidase-like deaminating enzyme